MLYSPEISTRLQRIAALLNERKLPQAEAACVALLEESRADPAQHRVGPCEFGISPELRKLSAAQRPPGRSRVELPARADTESDRGLRAPQSRADTGQSRSACRSRDRGACTRARAGERSASLGRARVHSHQSK